MGAAADDLKLTDEEKDHIRQRRDDQARATADEQRAQQEDSAKREDVATSFKRLHDMVNGERPTRESNAEYRFRKMSGEARRSLAR